MDKLVILYANNDRKKGKCSITNKSIERLLLNKVYAKGNNKLIKSDNILELIK